MALYMYAHIITRPHPHPHSHTHACPHECMRIDSGEILNLAGVFVRAGAPPEQVCFKLFVISQILKIGKKSFSPPNFQPAVVLTEMCVHTDKCTLLSK